MKYLTYIGCGVLFLVLSFPAFSSSHSSSFIKSATSVSTAFSSHYFEEPNSWDVTITPVSGHYRLPGAIAQHPCTVLPFSSAPIIRPESLYSVVFKTDRLTDGVSELMAQGLETRASLSSQTLPLMGREARFPLPQARDYWQQLSQALVKGALGTPLLSLMSKTTAVYLHREGQHLMHWDGGTSTVLPRQVPCYGDRRLLEALHAYNTQKQLLMSFTVDQWITTLGRPFRVSKLVRIAQDLPVTTLPISHPMGRLCSNFERCCSSSEHFADNSAFDRWIRSQNPFEEKCVGDDKHQAIVRPPEDVTESSEIIPLYCHFYADNNKLYIGYGRANQIKENADFDDFMRIWGARALTRAIPRRLDESYCDYLEGDRLQSADLVNDIAAKTRGHNGHFAVKRTTRTTVTRDGEETEISDRLLYPEEITIETKPIAWQSIGRGYFAYRVVNTELYQDKYQFTFTVCYEQQCSAHDAITDIHVRYTSEESSQLPLRLRQDNFEQYLNNLLVENNTLSSIHDRTGMSVWDAFDGSDIHLAIVEMNFSLRDYNNFNSVTITDTVKFRLSDTYTWFNFADTKALFGFESLLFPYTFNPEDVANHNIKVSGAAADLTKAHIIPVSRNERDEAWGKPFDIYSSSYSHGEDSSYPINQLFVNTAGNDSNEHLYYDYNNSSPLYINYLPIANLDNTYKDNNKPLPHTFITTNGELYTNENGTSYAAPRVSAILSLLQQFAVEMHRQKFTPYEVKFLLAISAKHRLRDGRGSNISVLTNPTSGRQWDQYQGFGELHVQQLFEAAQHYIHAKKTGQTQITVANQRYEITELEKFKNRKIKTIMDKSNIRVAANSVPRVLENNGASCCGTSIPIPTPLNSALFSLVFDGFTEEELTGLQTYGLDIKLIVDEPGGGSHEVVLTRADTVINSSVKDKQMAINLNALQGKVEGFYLWNIASNSRFKLSITNRTDKPLVISKVKVQLN